MPQGEKAVYADLVSRQLAEAAHQLNRVADTLYFGGGTPSLLPVKSLAQIIKAAQAGFGLRQAEITMEANPSSDLESYLKKAAQAGVNRLSVGLQSANKDELELLGRQHTAAQCKQAVLAAKAAGIDNVSVDIMLALPNQTKQKLTETLHFVESLGVRHVSVYLLKIEADTPFARGKLPLPDEDAAADLYLTACEQLEQLGFAQYEISNFAQSGYESRHNLKYWQGEEYLGLGPSAHSYINGNRFHFERDLEAYQTAPCPIMDGEGGSFEEKAMLQLRLVQGLPVPPDGQMARQAKRYEQAGLVEITQDRIRLTPKGFLVSNRLIAALLYG